MAEEKKDITLADFDLDEAFADDSVNSEVLMAALPQNEIIYGTERKTPTDERIRLDNEFGATIRAINEAIKIKKVLTGTVASVYPIPTKHGYDMYVCDVNTESDYLKITIPYDELFNQDPMQDAGNISLKTSLEKRAYENRQRQITSKVIDLPVSFIPKQILEVDEAERVVNVMASRRQALRKIRLRNYLGGGKWKATIHENEIYDARIISVGEQILLVELRGVETRIRKRNLTNRPIENLTTVFKVGQTIPVLVKQITPVTNAAGRPVDVTVILDAVAGETAQCRKSLKKIHPGAQVHAVVSKIRRMDETVADDIRFYGWVENYNVPLKIVGNPMTQAGRPMSVYDQIEVRVTEVDRNGDGYVRGQVFKITR